MPFPPPKSALRKGKAREPSHPPSLKSSDILREYLGQCHDAWRRKSWLEAKCSLKEATELWGGDCPPQWCVWGIQIAMAQSKWEVVTNLVEIAEHLHPHSADVHLASAHVSLITDRLPASMASLQSVLEQYPEHMGVRVLSRRLELISRARQDGDRLYATTEFSSASEKYTGALDV
ncbi:hypothetical protein FRB95_000357 [Tulasnella sp. JGI-2019a]|nr:hypothetical protein FRB95_000357 [Tulasnella sp. JGI-2019a]